MAATEELFRSNAYLQRCTATVHAADSGAVVLDRTVFFPTGGGQPGDTGRLEAEGQTIPITTTTLGDDGAIRHQSDAAALPPVRTTVTATIDWRRRYRHMRMHTAMHLLCAAVGAPVTGGQVGETKSRLDFNIASQNLDKDTLTGDIQAMIAADHPVSLEWWDANALRQRPELVRTMAVQPPLDGSAVRLVRIGDVDLQACGGTHVASTAELGDVRVGKIENKGRQNRRVSLTLMDPDREAPQ